MKKLIVNTLSLCCLIFIVSCDNQDLGGNYFYLPSYEAIDIGYPERSIIYKSNKKNVFSEVIIHELIIEVNSDKDFIIAIQQQKDSLNLKENLNHYFIINKNTDVVYGPLSIADFKKKREELEVPEELKFNQK